MADDYLIFSTVKQLLRGNSSYKIKERYDVIKNVHVTDNAKSEVLRTGRISEKSLTLTNSCARLCRELYDYCAIAQYSCYTIIVVSCIYNIKLIRILPIT